MPVAFEKYNPEKIALLKSMIVSAASGDKPLPFEICVDDMKVVNKTMNPDEFDKYEDFVNPAVKVIKIIIYNSPATNRNDKYFFYLNVQSNAEALEEGLGNVASKNYSQTEIARIQDERYLIQQQNDEIRKLRSQVSDLCDVRDNQEAIISQKNAELSRFENALELAETNRNTLHGINLGQVLANAAEALIRNNTASIAKVPGLSGIAAFIDEDTKQKYGQTETSQTPPDEGSFKRKNQGAENSASEISPQQQEFLRIFNHLQKHFNEPEMEQLFAILDFLSRSKADLLPVLELLRENTINKTNI